ncbi:MAG: DUF2067 domain-containing protein [Desulfurococcaceae archaeon]
MPLVKRKFYVPCSEMECLKLYELLKEKIPSVNYVSMNITEKGLLIEAYGYESDIKDLWFEVKNIVGPLKEITRKKGIRKYKVPLLVKMIHKTFPPRLLVEVLNRMNYRAEYREIEDEVLTDAPLEVITNMAEKIANVNNEAGKLAMSTSTRYYVVAACVLTNLTVEDVVRYSVELGLVRNTQDNRYVIVTDWRTTLDSFLKNVKR